jgi:biopolymer transport protein ExbB
MELLKTDFMFNLLQAVEDKKINEAIQIATNQKNPLARVIETTLRCLSISPMSEEKRLRTIQASGSKELRAFESHLRGLEMAANISPLLGLLGTVTGMVKAFSGIQQVGSRVDPSILAGGIWEALLTTVAGLAVAIPALAAHYIIDGRIEEARAKMKDSVTYILAKAEV